MNGETPLGLAYAATSGETEAIKVSYRNRELVIVTEPGLDPDQTWQEVTGFFRREGLI